VEKTSLKPDLVVTDAATALGLRSRVEIPVLALRPEAEFLPPDVRPFSHARSSVGLLLPARFAADEPVVAQLLERVDPAVDLSEPFARIREAVAEARKTGVTNRAA